MKGNSSARWMLIASMVIFGTLAPFVRNISVSSGELALYRAVMAAILIGGYFLVTRQRIDLRAIGRELPLLLVSGMAMGLNWILLFEAYRYTTVSVATLSYYFAPVLVTVLCPVLFREKLTAKQILCFAVSTLGLVLVVGVGQLTAGGQDGLGILFALGAAVLYAGVILLNKFIKGAQGLERTFLQFLAAVVVLVPYVALTGGITLGTMTGKGWLCLLTVGVIHTGAAYCLYFAALKDLPGQQAAILSYIDPLVAVIISVAVLGESLSPLQVVGGVLILGFAVINEIEVSFPKKRS